MFVRMNSLESHHVGVATHAAVRSSNPNLKPELLRVPDAVRVFGLCRSTLYELISAGKIKSTALRKRGAVRGIRLISFDSLAAYIAGAAANGGDTGES